MVSVVGGLEDSRGLTQPLLLLMDLKGKHAIYCNRKGWRPMQGTDNPQSTQELPSRSGGRESALEASLVEPIH